MRRKPRLDIDAELIYTDRVLMRWARSVGDGMPDSSWDGKHGGLGPLPDDAAVFVDQFVCKAHPRMRMFLHSWYRGHDPAVVLAKRFNVGRDSVYWLWRMYLSQCKPVFEAEPCLRRFMGESAEGVHT